MPQFHLNTPAGTVYAIQAPAEWSGSGQSDQWTVTDQNGRDVEWLDRRGYLSKPATMCILAPREVSSFTLSRPRTGPIDHWVLDEPDMESVRFPATLDLEAGQALRSSLDECESFPYRPVYAEGTSESVTIDVTDSTPWPTEGGPRPDLPEGAQWLPAYAWASVFGIPTHDHVIPGRLTGFHAAALALLAAHPNAISRFSGRIRMSDKTKAKVAFQFRYADGRTSTVGKGRRAKKQPAFQTIDVDVEVGPDEIHASNLDEALLVWGRRLDAVRDQIPEPSEVCSTCSGSGLVSPAHGERS